MLTTAPIGMVQAAQPAAQTVAANMPQTPAAARFTPVAVMGALPAATAQPQSKPPVPQTSPKTAAQIEASSVARTPESYLFEVELQEVPAPQTPPAPQGFQAGQRLTGGRESLIATQLMVQEDFTAADLPDTPDVARMIEQGATRRSQQAAAGEAGPAISVKLGHSAILPPTLPSLARPKAIEVMPSTAYTDIGSNAIQRRDTQGSVMQRGQTAYRSAAGRMGDYVPPIESHQHQTQEQPRDTRV